MVVRLDRHQVETLVVVLQAYKPRSSSALFILDATLKGSDDFTIFADDWPDPSHILMKHGRKEEKKGNAERAIFFCFRRDEEAFAKFLNEKEIFDFRVEHKLEDLPSDYLAFVQTYCSRNGLHVVPSERYDYHVSHTPDDSEVVGPIKDTSDLEEIAQIYHWHVSVGEVAYTVERYPSLCIKSKDGELGAFTFVQLYGGLGRLFVKPEYRRRGYATFLAQELSKLARQSQSGRNHPIYVRIRSILHSSIAFHERLGLRKVPDCNMHWFRIISNDNVSTQDKTRTGHTLTWS